MLDRHKDISINQNSMTVLIVGANGATGSKLVEQLLIEKHKGKVRSSSK